MERWVDRGTEGMMNVCDDGTEEGLETTKEDKSADESMTEKIQ